jgi:hypothetical protein
MSDANGADLRSDQELLHKLLLDAAGDATGDAGHGEPPADPALRRAQLDVARAHPNAPQLTRSIAQELVLSVTTTYFNAGPAMAAALRPSAAAVAATIMDDPVTSQRLAALWSTLLAEGT